MKQQIRIVLIDDDQDVCELLKMQLEESGRMRVSYSTSSEDALELIGRELPDIAILDINMPGVHGAAIGAELAAEPSTAGIPVLYLSGMLSPEEAEEMASGKGLPSLLSKGSPVTEVIAAIDILTKP